jgi:hypothetical protein
MFTAAMNPIAQTVFGLVFAGMGLGAVLMRGRIGRAQSASNREMFNGHLGGPKMTAYNSAVQAVLGGVFMVIGLLLAFHVIGAS